jgi:hypothetical protein
VATTRDHVFARCLLPAALPEEMLTAPACEECQQSLQPDEEYFRTFAAAGSVVDPNARALWDGRSSDRSRTAPGFGGQVTSRQVVEIAPRHPRPSRDLSEQLLRILTSFNGVHLGHRAGAEVAAV